MTQVYTIHVGWYDDRFLHGIYTDKDAAIAEAEAEWTACSGSQVVQVHEWQLDAPREFKDGRHVNPLLVLEKDELPYEDEEEDE